MSVRKITLFVELARHGIDIERESTRDEIIRSCEFYDRLGMIETNLYSQFTLLPHDYRDQIFSTDGNPERNRSQVVVAAFSENERLRNRIIDIYKYMPLIDVISKQ